MKQTTGTFEGDEDINRPLNEEDEAVLWSYIDGNLPASERTGIEKLVTENNAWASRYKELLELDLLLQGSGMAAPSVRFSKNVMEEIAGAEAAPVAKEYINKRLIWCISGTLLILIIGVFFYGMPVAGEPDTTSYQYIGTYIKEINYGAFFDRDFIHIFIMLNIIGALVLADRFFGRNILSGRKNDAHLEH